MRTVLATERVVGFFKQVINLRKIRKGVVALTVATCVSWLRGYAFFYSVRDVISNSV
ncbi:MAG: hypothetical protein WBB67_00355 [bacterium]